MEQFCRRISDGMPQIWLATWLSEQTQGMTHDKKTVVNKKVVCNIQKYATSVFVVIKYVKHVNDEY